MSKCRRMTVAELAKKFATAKGRALSAEEKAGLKVLAPQFVCSGSDAPPLALAGSVSARPTGHLGFDLGSYKPEVARGHSHLTPNAEARAKRSAKKASTRLSRRAAKADPENAPTRRIVKGYID